MSILSSISNRAVGAALAALVLAPLLASAPSTAAGTSSPGDRPSSGIRQGDAVERRAEERWVSIANPRFRDLKARHFWRATGPKGTPQFTATTHKVEARVMQFDERESKWDYYALRITTSKSSVRENGGGGVWMEFSGWTQGKTPDTSYTRSYQGPKSECVDFGVSLGKDVGPVGVSLSKAYPVFCSPSAKASLTTDYRGGRWRLSNPNLANSAEFHKVIRVKAGRTPDFTVRLGAPCHYYDYHGGVSYKNCYENFTVPYSRKRI